MIQSSIVRILIQLWITNILRCESTDIDDFRSILSSREETFKDNEKASKSSDDTLTNYGVHFIQNGNNFFFKPNFEFGPKYEKPLPSYEINDEVVTKTQSRQLSEEVIPSKETVLTNMLEANLKEKAFIPESPVLSSLMKTKIPIVNNAPKSLEIIPLSAPILEPGPEGNINEQQVIVGHTESLPSLKGSLNFQEILPLLFELIRPYVPIQNFNNSIMPLQPILKDTLDMVQQKFQTYPVLQNAGLANQSPRASVDMEDSTPYRGSRGDHLGSKNNLSGRKKNRRLKMRVSSPVPEYVQERPIQDNIDYMQNKVFFDTYAQRTNGAYMPYL